MDEKMKQIKDGNDLFVKSLKDLFYMQTKELNETIKEAIRLR